MKLKELFESARKSVADLGIDYKGGDFYCAHNKLTSLKDVHKHIAEIKGIFYAIKNPIESHVLGLRPFMGQLCHSKNPEQASR